MKKPVLVALCSVALIGIILIWSLSLPKGTVSVKGARAERVPNEPDALHLVLQIENGDQPDLLLGATSDAAQNIALISTTGQSSVPIPSNSTPVLSTDGAYIRLTGIEEELDEGRMIPVTLEFQHGKSLSTRAPVSAPTDPHAAHRAMIANADNSAERDHPAPSLDMSVAERVDGQWQVELELANFQFEPDSSDPVDRPGYGHAHLYVNGLKLQRMYSETATIGQLPPGSYQVRVSLNTNTHMPYVDDAGPVAAEATIKVE